MRKLITFALILLPLSVLVGCANSNVAGSLKASGTIETTEITVSAETGGRVTEVAAGEGDAVKSGQVLVRLDDALTQAQLRQAQAGLKAAQANYDLLAAGATNEQVRQATAAVAVAQANYDLLAAGPTDEQVRQAQAAVVVASANYSRTISSSRQADIAAAQSVLQAATDAYDKVKGGPLREDYAVAEATYRNAESALKQAQFAYDAAYQRNPAAVGASPAALALEQATNNDQAAKSAYDKVAKLPDNAQISAAYQMVVSARAALDRAQNPARDFDLVQARAQVEGVQAQLESVKSGARTQQLAAAKAQVEAAQAQRDALKAGARPQQLEAAKAQVEAAQAAIETLQAQIKKMTLLASADGVLLTRSTEPGEFAAPGAPLLTLARLDDLVVTVFISEDRYGQIKLGQSATLSVDSFPGERFVATVQHIADKAEFTPRNVQTGDGRRTTVFAVKLKVSDASGRLKPGMPVDVAFGAGG